MDLRLHARLFAAGDLAFLTIIGAGTNAAMLLVHSFRWNCIATLIVGMTAAMVIQMVLATLAAPLLGSIETMVPSMVVGMLGPMLICVWDPFTGGITYTVAAFSGAASGMFVFAALHWWAWTHKPLPTSTPTRAAHAK